MQSSVNFSLLLKQIGNYLEKAPNGTKEELKTANDALKIIIDVFYGGMSANKCIGGRPLVPPQI